jgi:hypothetical protein
VKFQSVLAIYILFWTMCLFVVLPFGVRTPEEEGVDCPPGPCAERAAPLQPRPRGVARDDRLGGRLRPVLRQLRLRLGDDRDARLDAVTQPRHPSEGWGPSG